MPTYPGEPEQLTLHVVSPVPDVINTLTGVVQPSTEFVHAAVERSLAEPPDDQVAWAGDHGDLLYTAWTIIANAPDAWTEPSEWRSAAERWRDRFHVWLALDVPVPSAPARHTDPETSHAAAKRDQDVGRFSKDSRCAALLRAVRQMGGVTDQEATRAVVGSAVASISPSRFEGCRRRMSDLRAAGYIADSGVRRKNPGSDDESIVWETTTRGVIALSRLADTGWSK
jgi:hypothetical protein